MAKALESAGQGRRARRSAAEWQAEVASWRASGLTATEYAKTQGVHAGTLMGWASRLAKGTGRTRRGESPPSKATRFIPVRVAALPSVMSPTDGAPRLSAEIVLKGGRRVLLSGEIRLDQLSQLLDALEGQRTC